MVEWLQYSRLAPRRIDCQRVPGKPKQGYEYENYMIPEISPADQGAQDSFIAKFPRWAKKSCRSLRGNKRNNTRLR